MVPICLLTIYFIPNNSLQYFYRDDEMNQSLNVLMYRITINKIKIYFKYFKRVPKIKKKYISYKCKAKKKN